MATRITRTTVCDFGDRHTGTISQWRLTTEGAYKVLELCPTCAKPLRRVWDRATGAEITPTRGKVYDMAEIDAQKREQPPS